MSNNRDIRIIGKRRAFEVGRFVLAVLAHAETLNADDEHDQPASNDSSSQPTEVPAPAPTPADGREPA